MCDSNWSESDVMGPVGAAVDERTNPQASLTPILPQWGWTDSGGSESSNHASGPAHRVVDSSAIAGAVEWFEGTEQAVRHDTIPSPPPDDVA